METVTSKDGTTIAYDKSGEGPVLILVMGALGFRSHEMMYELVNPLSEHFTVINYDRRGRGDSTDTPPYDVQREVEDIEALIDAEGGSAYLYGLSSGAVLALEVASKLPTKVTKAALYEPPLILDDSRPPIPADYVEQLNAAIAAGNPGGAVEIFMTKAVLIPEEFVEYMKNPPPGASFGEGAKPPTWAEMEAVAHTLPYDGVIVREVTAGNPLPAGKWASATSQVVVITGENSEPFFHNGAKALKESLPNAETSVLAGQNHAVSPAAIAPVLIEFFNN